MLIIIHYKQQQEWQKVIPDVLVFGCDNLIRFFQFLTSPLTLPKSQSAVAHKKYKSIVPQVP